MLADASKAMIIGFNVRPDANIRHKAEEAGVELPIQVRFTRTVVNEEGWQVGFLLNSHVQSGKVEGHNLEGVQGGG